MLDFVVFGATGYTGKYACYRLAQLQKEDPQLTFGIAGRSEAKLREVKAILEEKYDCMKFDVIIADVKDAKTLEFMCSQCKVLLSAVGPFRYFGEAVVKACVDTKTHYLDICGEPEFISSMMLKYYKQAEADGTYLVHSCGFDSVPADFGTALCDHYFRQQNGICDQVVLFHEHVEPENVGWFEPLVNSATFVALIESFSHQKQLAQVRKDLESQTYFTRFREVPRSCERPKMEKSWFLSPTGKHSFQFKGADNAVVRASQSIGTSLMASEGNNDRTYPFFSVYSSVNSWWDKISLSIFGLFFWFCLQFQFLHSWMKAYPYFFSLGKFVKGGPRPELLDEMKVHLCFHAKGTVNGEDKACTVRCLITDPGYKSTANILVASAMTILREQDGIRRGYVEAGTPGVNGGVITPAIAFANTTLQDRLAAAGMEFTFSTKD